MNQFKFYVSLMGVFFLGVILVKNEVQHAGYAVFLTSCLIVSLRRHYLKLTPWWGAPLRDIPKYFKKP